MAAREDVGQLPPAGGVLEKPVGAVPRGPSPSGQTAPLSEEAWVEVGREDCTVSASLPATPLGVLASVGLPVGGPQSQPVGAEPEGPCPPDETAQLSEGEWDEVRQESSCDLSLPATPEGVCSSAGSPRGSPQSPSRAPGVASGVGGPSDRAPLDGGRPGAQGPGVDDAMHAPPPKGTLTASLLAQVAQGGLGPPYGGAGGAAEEALLPAAPYVGPSAASLGCARGLQGEGSCDPFSPVPPAPERGAEYE